MTEEMDGDPVLHRSINKSLALSSTSAVQKAPSNLLSCTYKTQPIKRSIRHLR